MKRQLFTIQCEIVYDERDETPVHEADFHNVVEELIHDGNYVVSKVEILPLEEVS